MDFQTIIPPSPSIRLITTTLPLPKLHNNVLFETVELILSHGFTFIPSFNGIYRISDRERNVSGSSRYIRLIINGIRTHIESLFPRTENIV